MKYEKLIIANLDLFEKLGRNQTHFAQLLKESYPKELGTTGVEGIRAGIKAFFRDNPLPKIEQPIESVTLKPLIQLNVAVKTSFRS